VFEAFGMVGAAFAPASLAYLFFGCLLGIMVGALPGLTATMAVSLLVSLTYSLSSTSALAVLISVYLGAIYGGSRSAILLNVPGTPSSAATALDGFPLAKRGEGAYASILATTVSASGGIVGLAALVFATPLIAALSLKFGVWEYFWLAMFGIAISANLTTTSFVKGLIAGLIGLFVSYVGMDEIHGYPRFIFGYQNLIGGISLVPAMIGLFGFAEAADAIMNPATHLIRETGAKRESAVEMAVRSFRMVASKWSLFVRSAAIGTLIGAIPGVGPDIASWTAYGAAKRASKHPEEFGHGSYEGLIASETANNAATSGVFIPLLTLGIPGCAVTAVIIGAMRLHGLRPGPTFFFDTPGMVGFIAAALLITNIFIQLQGMGLTRLITKVLEAPVGAVMPVVIVLSVVGSYAISIRMFDVYTMLAFGLLGLVMRRLKIPSAPLALGIILGPLADLSFRRAMYAGRYSLAPFFTRPISAVLAASLAVMVLGPVVAGMIRRARKARE
jgi:putative tricarboxylic transport membrane protein